MDASVFIEPTLDLKRLAKVLDELGHEGRLQVVRRWNKHTQERIFAALSGFRPLSMEDFVPSSKGVLEEVIHDGHNSLPLFNAFQKRFARTEDGTIVGYNEGSMRGVAGAGYFTVKASESPGEVAIDYRELPKERVATWPAILPNSSRLGFLVFEGMVDNMRGLSEHVSVGRAWKKGKDMDAYFVLVRDDRPASSSKN
ncbi:MAG: hypothetical protein U0174_17165 [Polyangiaceae bacterium]